MYMTVLYDYTCIHSQQQIKSGDVYVHTCDLHWSALTGWILIIWFTYLYFSTTSGRSPMLMV